MSRKVKPDYVLSDGTVVPGVTTVIGASLGWNKNQLMAWAYKQGKLGLDFRRTRDEAADIGTLAHGLAEAYIRGQEYAWPAHTEEQAKAARACFESFLAWLDSSKLKPVEAELALVSEGLRCGGTIDCIATHADSSRHHLIDFKTSGGLYADHLIQVAAYSRFFFEVRGTPLERVHLLRFGSQGDFHHSSYTYLSLDKSYQAFVLLRGLWDLKRPVEDLT